MLLLELLCTPLNIAQIRWIAINVGDCLEDSIGRVDVNFCGDVLYIFELVKELHVTIGDSIVYYPFHLTSFLLENPRIHFVFNVPSGVSNESALAAFIVLP